MINTLQDRGELYYRLERMNLVRKLKSLKGYHRRVEDGKYTPTIATMAESPPWIYVKPAEGARCDLYHQVFFDLLGMIPSRCRKCWKVVIKPKTLRDLFTLYEYERMCGYPCKCGIETRNSATSLYGGYFYCTSKEEGLARRKQILSFKNEMLEPGTPVYLKRCCTEFEVGVGAKGPSDQLPEMTKEELAYEEYVLNAFAPVTYAVMQPDDMIAHIMQMWIEYAYQYHKATGDETFREFTGGKDLFDSCVTYEDSDIE